MEIGDGYRAKRVELADEGLPFARAANINDGFQFEGAERLGREAVEKAGPKVSKPGDVVFTSKGTVGRFALVQPETEQFAYSPQLCYWRSLDPSVLLPRYLYYWMNGPGFFEQVAAVKGQTDMAEYVSLRDQRRMTLPLPPLDEQERIADTLGVLDDKIEANRRMNATLDALARVVFRERFGRFATGDDLPEGWTWSRLKDEFDLTMGQSPPGSTYNEEGEGLPFYQGATDFGFRFPEVRRFCTAPTRTASPGDTLVSVRAPVGLTNLAPFKLCLGRGVAALRHRDGGRSYTYWTADHLRQQFEVFNAEGTVFGSINKRDFGNLRVVAPASAEIEAFESVCSALDDRVEANLRQNETLAELRDRLIPALLSGAVRVGDLPEREVA
jgi:type I restriction enzyme S subunit